MKLQWKITVDTGMMLALLLLMGYGLIGEQAHEWIGMGMFVLFLAHLVLNRKWFQNLGKGRYSPVRIVQIVLNSLIFLCMVGCMVSGIALSRYLFHIQTEYTVEAAMEKVHMFCAYWGFVLMCLHLGTHWGMMLNMARKHWKLPKRGDLYLSIIGYLVALLGIPALLRRDVADYLFLRSHFVFMEYSEPVSYFLRDYLLIAVLFVTVGHEGIKLLRKWR